MLRQTFVSNHCARIQAFVIVIGWLFSALTFAETWQTLAPGIDYLDLNRTRLTPWSHVHVFRIDLNKNTLDVVTAKDVRQNEASLHDLSTHSQALISINGGFFDEQYRPLGLRLGHQHRESQIKPISWWGIFYVANKRARVVQYDALPAQNSLEFAVQSGPRLLVNGNILKLKPGHAERTALGITSDGRVIMVTTEHMPLTTSRLAQLMKQAPLHCDNALNLDGGSSTQLIANINEFHLNTAHFNKLSDAIIVKSRA